MSKTHRSLAALCVVATSSAARPTAVPISSFCTVISSPSTHSIRGRRQSPFAAIASPPSAATPRSSAGLGPKTRVVDLQGRLAIPGFIDGHGHYTGLGESKLVLDLTKAQTWDDIVAQVRDAASSAQAWRLSSRAEDGIRRSGFAHRSLTSKAFRCTRRSTRRVRTIR